MPMQQQWQRSSMYGPGSRMSGFADQWVLVGSRISTIPEQSRRKSVSSTSSRSELFRYIILSELYSKTPTGQHRSSSTPASRKRHSSASSPSNARRSAVSPPPSGANRRSISQHARSASSLRHEVQQSPPALPTPARTYSGLADLAESSFEASDVVRDRGRVQSSPQPPPLGPPSSPAKKHRTSGSSSNARSQSKGRKPSRQQRDRDPVR